MGFKSIAHVFAAVGQKIVAEAKFVESKILPLLHRLADSEETVEKVTALVNPDAANIERVAFAGLGKVIEALESGAAAIEENGVNIALDAEFIADVKAIIPAIKAAAATTAPAVRAA